MSTNTSLEYIIYQKEFDEAGAAHDQVTMTGGLTQQDFNLWRGIVSLEPFEGRHGSESETVGLFSGPDQTMILARARFPQPKSANIVYQFTRVPVADFIQVSDNLRWMLETTAQPNLEGDTKNGIKAISPLQPPASGPANPRLSVLQRMNRQGITVPRLLHILGGALHQRKVALLKAAVDLDSRLDLVEALMLLLPAPARPTLTFSTGIRNWESVRGRVVFGDKGSADQTDRWLFDLTGDQPPVDEIQNLPYIRLLTSLWSDDLAEFVEKLHSVDQLAGELMPGYSISEGLNLLANRHFLDTRVITGEMASPIELQEALASTVPPAGAVRDEYLKQLLTHALAERESDAVELVLRYMAEHPEVETLIRDELSEVVEKAPDDVYFFLRASLVQEMDDDRLTILRTATELALRLALDEEDTTTLLTWFNLVAREPGEYGLNNILRQSIKSAQLRAHDDGELGRELLAFVARRTPDLLDDLLADDKLIAALAPPLGPAIREFDSEATDQVFEIGREISLVVLRLAADAGSENEHAAALFDEGRIQYLWALLHNGINSPLSEHYHADSLIETLIDASGSWLPQDGVLSLLDFLVGDHDLDRLIQLCRRLNDPKFIIEQLPMTFQNNALEAEDIMQISEVLVEAEVLTAQNLVDLLLRTAAIRDWEANTRRLIEYTARILQQNHELKASLDVLWPMLRVASGEPRMETVASTVTRRLLAYVESVQDDGEMVAMIQRLHQRLEWSKNLRTYIQSWWRGYLRSQSLARLQQLERALDGKKELVDEHAIVQTSVAIRRMLGQESLADFAADVATTHSLLQVLSESFDPAHRQFIAFDPQAVKDEIAAHSEEMTSDEYRVLSKNLQELALLIVNMSDSRTKPAIMRREDDVERQLIEGELQPQSAIDTMRWLTGFLLRLQAGDEDEVN